MTKDGYTGSWIPDTQIKNQLNEDIEAFLKKGGEVKRVEFAPVQHKKDYSKNNKRTDPGGKSI